MTTVYFAGGEDHDLVAVGGGIMQNTAGRFRSAYARGSLLCNTSGTQAWRNVQAFTASTFWFSGQHFLLGGSLVANSVLWNARDVNGIVRLRMRNPVSTTTYIIEKLDAAGTATQLGSSFVVPVGITVVEKLDISIVYAVAGSITLYWNNILLFTYSGDTTTNSITSLSYVQVGAMSGTGGNASAWSEIMVLDVDTRSLSLQTLAPTANGNTHNFDTGTPAAANVNEQPLSDATLDGSTTAGQIDQYTIPAIVTGTFGILAVGINSRMTKGGTGPSKMDFGFRVSGTDYWSSDITLTSSWDCYSYWLTADPATAVAWIALPTNIGLKSVT